MSIGILLINLGTPDAPTPSAVRRYLAEFLWDPRVVEIPRPLWWLLLHGLVLPLRPRKTAALYQKIWTDQGSPLLIHSQRIAKTLQHRLEKRLEKSTKVVLAMRYGSPSIAQGLAELQAANVQQLLIFPLYPQYSAPTTASAFDAVSTILKTWRHIPELRMINNYATEPAYIEAIVTHIKNHWQKQGKAEHLLFSFHGLPKHFVAKGDPYEKQCYATAERVAAKLELAPTEWRVTFQSRFGKAEWLTPYCDKTLQAMPQQQQKSVDVVCPGFAVDCLETLEEIAQTNAGLFYKAGGEYFSYISALNDSELHIQALEDIGVGCIG